MNIMNRVTWRAMWKNKLRTIVTIMGVAISAAMFMAVTTAVYSLWDFMVRGYRHEVGDFFVQFDYSTDEQAGEMAEYPGIAHITDMRILGTVRQLEHNSPDGTYRVAAVDEAFYEHMPVLLTEGRFPDDSGEILLPEHYNVLQESVELPAVELGQQVTFQLRPRFGPDVVHTDVEEPFEKTYTVVGFIEDRTYTLNDEHWLYYAMLTVADGDEGLTLWHRLFAKTEAPEKAWVLSREPLGEAVWLYQDLMNLYGATMFSDVNLMLYLLAAVLCFIILIASVSLIGNAFSISVSERTKQFGLLAGVGATKKQLRSSVLFEAAAVGCIGIPLGLIFGFAGIAVVLNIYGQNILRLFSFSVSGGVAIYAAPSWVAAFAAVLICGITILLSAWLPSRRATRVSPIESIRQNTEYRPGAKEIKTGYLTGKLFGIPGLLGKKYFKVSKKKYRATVFSLCISLILFITAAYFSQTLNMLTRASGRGAADFSCISSAVDPQKDFQAVSSLEGVEESAVVSDFLLMAVCRSDDMSDGYKEVRSDEGQWNPQVYSDGGWCVEEVTLRLVEDAVFEAYLRKEGIDPTPYLTGDTPVAVRVNQTYGGYYVQNEAGEWNQLSYYGSPFGKKGDIISVFPQFLPDAVRKHINGSGMIDYSVTEDGNFVFNWHEANTLIEDTGSISPVVTGEGVSIMYEVTEEQEKGAVLVNFYLYDGETKQHEAVPIHSEYMYIPQIQIGAKMEINPFAASAFDASGILLLLPVSRAEILPDQPLYPQLALSVSDEAQEAVLSALEEYSESSKGTFFFTNHIEEEMNLRGILEVVFVFATGFILLISLISAANVFNTISTNFALRQRDFGMLRSVGMKPGELYRMAAFECMNYGLKALVWGLPLSVGACYGIFEITNLSYAGDFSLPWGTVFTGVGCIFAVVFVTMLYAISTLRRATPIEAIRTENV